MGIVKTYLKRMLIIDSTRSRVLNQRLFITRRVTLRFNMGRHFEFKERQGPSRRLIHPVLSKFKLT